MYKGWPISHHKCAECFFRKVVVLEGLRYFWGFGTEARAGVTSRETASGPIALSSTLSPECSVCLPGVYRCWGLREESVALGPPPPPVELGLAAGCFFAEDSGPPVCCDDPCPFGRLSRAAWTLGVLCSVFLVAHLLVVCRPAAADTAQCIAAFLQRFWSRLARTCPGGGPAAVSHFSVCRVQAGFLSALLAAHLARSCGEISCRVLSEWLEQQASALLLCIGWYVLCCLGALLGQQLGCQASPLGRLCIGRGLVFPSPCVAAVGSISNVCAGPLDWSGSSRSAQESGKHLPCDQRRCRVLSASRPCACRPSRGCRSSVWPPSRTLAVWLVWTFGFASFPVPVLATSMPPYVFSTAALFLCGDAMADTCAWFWESSAT